MSKGISFYFTRSWEIVRAFLCLPLAFHPFRSRRLVVVGAWFGDLYADNPKYLVEYILRHSDLQVVWIGKAIVRAHLPKHPHLRFALQGSFHAFAALLRAKTWVCCQSIEGDLTPLPIMGNAICINLWHGIPLKRVGSVTPKAIRGAGRSSSIPERIYNLVCSRIGRKPEWLLVSSGRMAEILIEGNGTRFSSKAILPFGTPRNDFLIRSANDKDLMLKLKAKYANLLGFDPSRKIISYLPTFRMDGGEVFTFYSLPLREQRDIAGMLEDSHAVLVEQHHYMTYRHSPPKPSFCSILVTQDLKPFVDTQELLLATDILVCDYSGAYIDFSLLKRPCIHFAYDLDAYIEKDSGMAYNLNEVAAGDIAKDFYALKKALGDALAHPGFCPAGRCKELTAYESGRSCERLLGFIESADC